MVLDSRQLKPAKYLAAMQQPANLPMNAEKMIVMVYAHVIPGTKSQKRIVIEIEDALLSSKPRSVESPESVKYRKHTSEQPKVRLYSIRVARISLKPYHPASPPTQSPDIPLGGQ
jgi:hypothetical protein